MDNGRTEEHIKELIFDDKIIHILRLYRDIRK